MPTVLRSGGYRFFFYSLENDEPPVHVERGDQVAKYWLEPVELASSRRFRSHELSSLRALVLRHRQAFLRAWHEHFDD